MSETLEVPVTVALTYRAQLPEGEHTLGTKFVDAKVPVTLDEGGGGRGEARICFDALEREIPGGKRQWDPHTVVLMLDCSPRDIELARAGGFARAASDVLVDVHEAEGAELLERPDGRPLRAVKQRWVRMSVRGLAP